MRHHPDDALLFGYAAGTQTAAVELLLAAHLTGCPACRARVAALEAVAGTALAAEPAEPADSAMLARLLARLESPAASPDPMDAGSSVVEEPSADGLMLPRPLRRRLGPDVGRLQWRRAVRGVDRAPLAIGNDTGRAYLLRSQPDSVVPRHRHAGSELVLVLDGGYSDAYGHYLRGDVSLLGAGAVHHPKTDSDGVCLCLVVADGPIRLTGPARLLNALIR